MELNILRNTKYFPKGFRSRLKFKYNCISFFGLTIRKHEINICLSWESVKQTTKTKINSKTKQIIIIKNKIFRKWNAKKKFNLLITREI